MTNNQDTPTELYDDSIEGYVDEVYEFEGRSVRVQDDPYYASGTFYVDGYYLDNGSLEAFPIRHLYKVQASDLEAVMTA